MSQFVNTATGLLLAYLYHIAGEPNEVKKQHVTGEAEGVGRPVNNNLPTLSWLMLYC